VTAGPGASGASIPAGSIRKAGHEHGMSTA